MTLYATLKLLERAQPILANAAKDPALTGEQEAHRLLVAEEVRKAAAGLEAKLMVSGLNSFGKAANKAANFERMGV